MTDARPPRRDDYAPYHTLDAFAEGVADYSRALDASRNYHGLYAQAYDRGQEYAMRVERFEARRQ